MKIVPSLAIWLVVLIGGAVIVDFLCWTTDQGGTGNGVGFFRYRLRCNFFPFGVGEDPSIARIRLEAEAPARFMFYGGVSPAYETISMEWALQPDYEGRAEGRMVFDLVNDTIRIDGRRIPLDSGHLREILGIPDRPENLATLKYLLDFLDRCHTGRVSKPSHFVIEAEEPMLGTIRHAALGRRAPYPIVTWTGIWLLMVTTFYTRKRICGRC